VRRLDAGDRGLPRDTRRRRSLRSLGPRRLRAYLEEKIDGESEHEGGSSREGHVTERHGHQIAQLMVRRRFPTSNPAVDRQHASYTDAS
jgi:hypothetical protein